MRVASFCIAVSLTFPHVAPAQPTSAARVSVQFADVETGRRLLTAEDEFIVRLSKFDRAARLKTDGDVSQAEFLEFLRGNVLAWLDEEQVRVQNVWNDLTGRMIDWDVPFPNTIYFIKTTGKEEGGQPYTRGNAVVLPAGSLGGGERSTLRETIAHELFHVVSRHAPALRSRLYGLIGFRACGEVRLPTNLVGRKLTNPDAPVTDQCIRLNGGGQDAWFVPVLFSRADRYDVTKGGEFFAYAQLRFLQVSTGADPRSKTAEDLPDTMFEEKQLTGFFEQTGRNTNYIVHPEEILADNFRLLLLGTAKVASPEVLSKLSAVFRSTRNSAPSRD